MEPNERWSKRPHSSITQRNVDKELQRIKSLAVVSVLNKSFNKDLVTPSRSSSLAVTISPSSSLTTDSDSLERSQSDLASSDEPSRNDSTQTTSSSPRSDGQLPASSVSNEQLAEKEPNRDLVMNSADDIEKESLLQRIQELEDLYSASRNELYEAETKNNAHRELVMIQDKLIQNMSAQIEQHGVAYQNDSPTNIDLDTNALHEAQQELRSLREEMLDFRSMKAHYTTIISEMSEKLTAYDAKMDEIERIAKDIHKEHSTQIEFIDTKVQTLVNKLLESTETINRLQVEHIQEKLANSAKDDPNIDNSAKSLNDSSSVIWEATEEDHDGDVESIRSSSMSVSSRSEKRKSFIARWKGSAIPPASPPPSLPLPPIPTTNARNNRPRAILSEIYGTKTIIPITTTQNKHISMDAAGGGRRRPSDQSDVVEAQLADAAYYKEFTDQLQERLSVSKEIDHLEVWEPSDYDAIQRKIESKNWSESEDGSSQRDQGAFWKGMKKKLRV